MPGDINCYQKKKQQQKNELLALPGFSHETFTQVFAGYKVNSSCNLTHDTACLGHIHSRSTVLFRKLCKTRTLCEKEEVE